MAVTQEQPGWEGAAPVPGEPSPTLRYVGAVPGAEHHNMSGTAPVGAPEQTEDHNSQGLNLVGLMPDVSGQPYYAGQPEVTDPSVQQTGPRSGGPLP